ncbi:MAG: aldehyde-activating protein [Gammaproteobacteria bacterium]|nr:aldehyde-activating protein [Gammaproteobacteria bacterium]
MKAYPGQCFCGSIGYEYSTDTPPADWSIRACQCAFCRAHDALSASDPAGELRFHAGNPPNLQRYRFAMRTADFLLCRECGVYIGAVIETGQGRFGIINTHSLAEAPGDIAAVEPISYDKEDKAGRVGRREERWTPVTHVPW